jgi:hypothetical protein
LSLEGNNIETELAIEFIEILVNNKNNKLKILSMESKNFN